MILKQRYLLVFKQQSAGENLLTEICTPTRILILGVFLICESNYLIPVGSYAKVNLNWDQLIKHKNGKRFFINRVLKAERLLTFLFTLPV